MKVEMKDFPRDMSRRVRALLNAGQRVVLVPGRGRPRVFRYQAYQDAKERPKRIKPWLHRRRLVVAPDPLGAKQGRVLGPLSRREIYD